MHMTQHSFLFGPARWRAVFALPVLALWVLALPVAANPVEQEEIILNSPANLQSLQILLGPELLQAQSAPGAALDPAATPTAAPAASAPAPTASTASTAPTATLPPASAASGRQLTPIRAGETLDRVIARTLGRLAGAPRATARQAFVQLNPHGFLNGSPHRMRAGVQLAIPTPQDLQTLRQQQAAGQPLRVSPPEGTGSHANSPERPSDPNDRRNWVRFP